MCQATEIWECGQSVQVAVSNTEATRTVSVRGVLGTLGVGGEHQRADRGSVVWTWEGL